MVAVAMILLSVTSLVGGSYIACISQRYPKQSQQLDNMAGVLLIAGLAIVGASQAAFY